MIYLAGYLHIEIYNYRYIRLLDYTDIGIDVCYERGFNANWKSDIKTYLLNPTLTFAKMSGTAADFKRDFSACSAISFSL